MDIVITSRRIAEDPPAKALLSYLQEHEIELQLKDAILYYDYPTFRDYADEEFRPDIMILSSQHGVIVMSFMLAEDIHAGESRIIARDQDLTQFFTLMFGRLMTSRVLRRDRNNLVFPVTTFHYIPSYSGEASWADTLENSVLFGLKDVGPQIRKLAGQPINDQQLAEGRSIIEGARALRKPKPRVVPKDDRLTKAVILSKLEDEIANFDVNQRKTAITIIDGPQRIRGLAGSGKTIVLAMKAAHLHLVKPDARILYTFFTRSLYDFVKLIITRFYRHFKEEDPNWDLLNVYHAWGGQRVPGVYYNACINNGVPPITYTDAKAKSAEPFPYVCGELIKSSNIKCAYDHILIDEAQDFPVNFFKLSYYLTRGDNDRKSIVWAYDDLQSIFNVGQRSPAELFGVDENGVPLIDLERAGRHLPEHLRNDVVLQKCYRNPREILMCAHALGFGLYSDHTIVQMLENTAHWEDVGYQVTMGDCQPGQHTEIFRPEQNSPLSIARYQRPRDLISYYVAANFDDEISWVVDQIKQFIQDGLYPHDILVIAMDDRYVRSYFSKIVPQLVAADIQVNDILANPYSWTSFIVENKVTLSTVYRAKGNEAAAVIAVGVDAVYPQRKSRMGRNKLFTAFTRAKAWMRVSGVGPRAKSLFREIDSVLRDYPYFKFEYPDPAEVETVQRDLRGRAARLRELKERYAKELTRLGLSDEEAEDWFQNGGRL